MFALILPVCLTADPSICAERVLPAATAPDQAACQTQAETVVPAWLAVHEGLTGGKWRCADAAGLPALDVIEAAPGVFVHRGADGQLSPENRGRIANLSFVVGTDAVAVIDAGTTREEGEALYAAILHATDKPIRHLVLTHMHPDHILGAEAFAEAGAELVADRRQPDAVAARAETWMESIPRQIGAQPFLGTRIVPATRLIEGETTLDLGGGAALVLTPAPAAHTDNDLTAFEPRSGTWFPEDLVFRGLTPVVDGSLKGWLAWMDRPAPAGTRLVVPGHGPLAATFEEAGAAQRAYLTALRDAVRAQLDAGTPMSAALPAVGSVMAPLADGWADFEETTARNAAAAYSEMEWD